MLPSGTETVYLLLWQASRGNGNELPMKKFIPLVITFFLFSCLSLPVKAPDTPSGVEDTEIAQGPLEAFPDPAEDNETAVETQNLAVETQDFASLQPPPLTFSEISRLVDRLSGSRCQPLHMRGRILPVLYDLDGNGYEDVFILCAETGTAREADITLLSDVSRLFGDTMKRTDFFINVYTQVDGTLVQVHSIPLGRKYVFESFAVRPMGTSERAPFAISAVFQSPEGSEQDWALFPELSVFSKFSMRESLSVHTIIRDLDENGIFDVMAYQDVYEEGAGYETYLTWYRWNGRDLSVYKTVNVVRSLKAFTDMSAGFLLDGDWRGFAEHCFSGSLVRGFRSSGLSWFKIFHQVFKLVPSDAGPENQLVEEDARIAAVVFSEIQENPFNIDKIGPYEIPASVRLVSSKGNHVYHANIRMNRNPFSSPQFSFTSP